MGNTQERKRVDYLPESWWSDFFDKGKPMAMRNHLIEHHLPIVRAYAYKLHKRLRGVDFDDLYNDACWSFIKQVDTMTRDNYLVRICSIGRIVSQGCCDRHIERTPGYKSPYLPAHFMVLECDLDSHACFATHIENKVSTESAPYERLERKERRQLVVKCLRRYMPAHKAAFVFKYLLKRPLPKGANPHNYSNRVSAYLTYYIRKRPHNLAALKHIHDLFMSK